MTEVNSFVTANGTNVGNSTDEIAGPLSIA